MYGTIDGWAFWGAFSDICLLWTPVFPVSPDIFWEMGGIIFCLLRVPADDTDILHWSECNETVTHEQEGTEMVAVWFMECLRWAAEDINRYSLNPFGTGTKFGSFSSVLDFKFSVSSLVFI